MRLLSISLLLAACTPPPSAPPEQTPPSDGAAFEQRAAAATQAFQQALQKELQQAIAVGGPAHAVSVCSERAPAITATAAGQAGLSLRRIGTRVRNAAANTPSPAEARVLAGLTAEAPSFVGELDGALTYMRAIHIQAPLCLTCHGQPSDIPAEVATVLASRYPDDKATGYAVGDLRGAFVVKAR